MNQKYKEYLSYVKHYLTEHQGIESPNPMHPFRSRFQHTIRVLHWCSRLTEGMEGVDLDLLCTAAIFHDIGYGSHDNEYHAYFIKAQGMDEEFSKQVQWMIANHSDKSLMREPGTSLEMILLMEADLMDEEGAMGIVWDCMVMGNIHASSYLKAYEHIMESSNKQEPNPMVTQGAKKIWEQKKQIVSEFAEQLKEDLMVGSEYFDI